MTGIVQIDASQAAQLNGYLQSGSYADAYRYLRDVSLAQATTSDAAQASELLKMANWFDAAASINSNDGSFVSDMVRGATIWQGTVSGLDANEAWFQAGSDALATTVVNDVLAGRVSSLDDIIGADVMTAVDNMQLGEPDAWAGTLGDMLPPPFGLGEDFVSIDGEGTVTGYLQDLSKSLLSNIDGVLRWAGISDELDGSMGWVMDHGFGKLIDLLRIKMDWAMDNGLGGFIDHLEDLAALIRGDSTYRVERYDPLALDLDGDGKVTTTAEAEWTGSLFDNDADGIRTATGWVGPGDGLLVRDLNGDGLIDSGRELFGDQTVLQDGSRAANGFAALAAMDTNGDGEMDSSDADFASLRVWRDANGNGVTDAGELLELEQLHISSLATGADDIAHVVVDGGMRTGAGTFTRVLEDGVVSGVLQEFEFSNDALHSKYNEDVQIPEGLKDLANLSGMGKLRDLREACVLSSDLEQDVRAFSAAPTRATQREMLDTLLYDWAKTSPTFTSGGIKVHSGGGIEDASSSNVIRLRPGEVLLWSTVDLAVDVVRKIRVVEAVLGSAPITDIWWGDTTVNQYLTIYDTLFEGTYGTLASQTRLKEYIKLVDVAFSNDSFEFAFDYSELDAALVAKHANAPATAIVDLSELLRFNGQLLVDNDWSQGEALLRGWLTEAESNGGLQAELVEARVIFGDAVNLGNVTTVGTEADEVIVGRDQTGGVREVLSGGDGNDVILAGSGVDTLNGDAGNDLLCGGGDSDSLDGGAGNDALYGGEGADSLSGGAGDDVLYGEGGNDALTGAAGNDTLSGGVGSDSMHGGEGDDRLDGSEGNDYLSGDAGDDTYMFGRGAGHDTINNYDLVTERKDVLQLDAGITISDIKAWRSGDDLCLQIIGTEDRVDIQYYFRNDGYSDYRLDEIRFADGTAWDIETVKTMVLVAGNGNDDIYGYETDDVITGSGDNDWLVGRGGNDTLSGGAGADSLGGDDDNDTLSGDEGEDVLSGGSGNDVLRGGADDDRLAGDNGDDRLEGGTGNDYLAGGAGNDTYVFTRGDGRDTIYNNDSDAGRIDSLEFAAGIGTADVVATRIGDDLSLQISGSDDRVYVQQYFRDDAVGAFRLDAIRFADGTVWDVDAVKALVQVGTDGNDTLVGYVGNDTLSGGLGDDSIAGGDGDDALSGGAGADFLDGGNGVDTLAGDDGNDTLSGGAGDDHLLGGSGLDALYGGDGNDVIDGGADRDWLSGEAGDDQLSGGDGDDEIRGGDGADTLAGETGDDLLYGGAGEDRYVFVRGDGKDRISDLQGLNTLALDGLPVTDVRMRRDGTTLVIRFASSSGDEVRFEQFFDGATGLATASLAIDTGSLWSLSPQDIDAQVMLGTAVDDTIFGNVLGNTIDGLGGQDIVRAGEGDDIVDGGDGGDQLYGEGGNDQLFGGAGDDLLDGGDGVDALSGGIGNDDLAGGAGADTLDGGDGADHLWGGTDNDLLRGGADGDVLDGGTGQDQMYGGSGDDVYLVDDAGDTVTEVAGEGQDTIRSTVSYTLSANVERLELAGVASVVGTGNALDNELVGNGGANRLEGLDGDDVLQGNDGDDTLVGGAGNDLLDGGRGIDQSIGGAGDDTYAVDAEGDVIVELVGEGFDVVNAFSSYTLSENIEKLVLVEGSGAWQGAGNSGDNTILGNTASNRLDGGTGADLLAGGLGDDTYVVDNVGDQVVEAAGEGEDTVESSIDYVLGATLENLTLLGTANLDGTGNDQDNVLVGNAGNNRLEGGQGADSLYGGLGDDYFIEESSDDWAYENAGEGLDTVERRYETNLVLKDNVENLILADGVATGNGNDLDNLVTGNSGDNTLGGWDGDDTLQGLDGNDALFGGTGSDTLIGGAGDDYLDGGTGVDHLEGGAGNDNYIVDDGSDVVIEAANGGTDQVQASASYALSANVENLFLTGSADIDGTGNDLDNYIAGNGGANRIDGGGGNDTMVAGGGDDLLIGGAGDDKYVFDVSSGSDVIDNSDGGFDGVFFTGGITRERLSFDRDGDDLLIFVDAGTAPAVRVTNHFLGGDAAIDYVQPDGGYYLTTAEINQIVAGGSTGGQYDQVIEGTAAGEQLVGSAGKDLIKGLAGDDQLFGLAGDDALQGGDGDDYLAGGNGGGDGSGADRLEGGAGNDTLSGEDGNDTLIGGTGDDSYVYGGGQDTIDNTGGGYDGVFFNDGITASQLGFSRDGDDLVITVDGDANRTVRVTNHFVGGDAAIDFVQPASGSMLDTAAINALIGGGSGGPGTPTEPGNDGDYTNIVDGTAAGEQLLGTNGRDLIHGLGGDDTIFGFGGDDKFDGGDGNDYLSGGNGSFSGSGNDILIGGAGSDTLVGEDGDDLLLGGTGDDQYIWQAGSGSDVIDNTGGGTDWLFFNGVDRSRLSFHQSGDDLIILVDGDLAQQVRVQNHFQGGDLSISYVQPSGGYAIPASDFAGLLTPLPTGFAPNSVSTMSLMANESITPMDTLSAQAAADSRSSLLSRARGDHQPLPGRSARGFGPDMIDELLDRVSVRGGRAFGHASGIGREAQQLIEAMSRFHPISAETAALHQDANGSDAMLIASSIHPFREPLRAAMP